MFVFVFVTKVTAQETQWNERVNLVKFTLEIPWLGFYCLFYDLLPARVIVLIECRKVPAFDIYFAKFKSRRKCWKIIFFYCTVCKTYGNV